MVTDINLRMAFDLFDLDSNGKITPYELKKVLTQNKTDANIDEQWDKLVQEFDTNNDGCIDFHEFKAMMIKLHNEAEEEERGAAFAFMAQ